ncbi:MAG: ATP-dependent helicase HrpB [Gammaproteobacteria bacterium]|nr:ATP-dependent helicase HrpB [Gammaproteobacteria bacterium]
MPNLPIENILQPLRDSLREHPSAVLTAAPGAGKTTRVPLALMDESWLAGKRIIMLEPRRLAARNAATWMAHQLNEPVGHTVGYRMRMDSKVSEHTRIEVVTEGILTRLLQKDPLLEEYGLVIFDEYHERSLQADLGLALTLEVQTLRDDLRILVMSATLEGETVSRLLADAPLLHSDGRSYPVDIHYLPVEPQLRLDVAIVNAANKALTQESGSVLVFLPGAGEIRRVHEALSSQISDEHISVYPLYGNLSQEEQEQAIEPAIAGHRKIVLATAIAETSLTIEGVRVVIDAGQMRVPRFDPRSGMTRLHTLRVSRASAEQRCGRAGRTESGVCYRLWDEATQNGLVPYGSPEILEADLAPLALELAQWGVSDPGQLAWLDTPPQGSYQQSVQLLQSLQALDTQGRISSHGKAMLRLGLHPRLAHMVLKAKEIDLVGLACDLAALLNERDIFRLSRGEHHVDLRSRLEALHDKTLQQRYHADRATIKRVLKESQQLRRRFNAQNENSIDNSEQDSDAIGHLLALAYPDRIAQLRSNSKGRYRLSNGKGAMLNELDSLSNEPYLVMAELDGQSREANAYLAAPVSLQTLERELAELIQPHTQVGWDDERGIVIASQQQRLGELVLDDTPLQDITPEQIREALLNGIRDRGIDCLPWDDGSRHWQQRVQFLERIFPDQPWPDVSNEQLLATLNDWLGPYLNNMNRLEQLKRLSLTNIFNGMLEWEQQQALQQLAPTHIDVPSGSRIAIDYSEETPILAVRLQEMFGLTDTPTIANGRVALLLHLLSPARRPMQMTKDLKSFWQNGYPLVKKDLKGRYPKHYWPDDPLQAEATARAKPRK